MRGREGAFDEGVSIRLITEEAFRGDESRRE